MHSAYVLLCIKPCAKAGRNNVQQGGPGSCPQKFRHFCLTPLFILREQVWVTGRAPETHGGLKRPACPPTPIRQQKDPEDCGIRLSNGNSTATSQTCSTQSSHWHRGTSAHTTKANHPSRIAEILLALNF